MPGPGLGNTHDKNKSLWEIDIINCLVVREKYVRILFHRILSIIFFLGILLQFKVIKKKEKKKKKDITSYDNLRVVCIYIFFPKFYENPAGGINPKPPPLNQKEN